MPKLSLREQRHIAAEEKRSRQRRIMVIIAILIVLAVVLIIYRSIQVNNQTQASTAATETSVAITPTVAVASSSSTDMQFPGLISDTVKTASGLQYKDIVVGNGDTAQAGKTVSVQYTGWLTDGTQFDSSLSSGKAFEFVLGKGSVIKGWDEGVAGMKVGSSRILIIPPDLAYGSSGAGSIPANSTLVFQVQLLAIK